MENEMDRVGKESSRLKLWLSVGAYVANKSLSPAFVISQTCSCPLYSYY